MEIALIALADIVSLLALGIAWTILRRKGRAVREITASAETLASGKWEGRVAVTSGGDVGHLAQAFNNMAERLQQVFTDLAGEKDKLSAVLSTMSEGVIMVEPDDTVGLVNPATQRLLDASVSPGRRLIEQFRDFSFHQILHTCRSAGTLQTGEIEIAGGRRYLAVTATPMATSSPQPSRILVVLHDITDVRKAERTRREFVANVSHELRTPLSSMKAALETLSDGAVDDKEAAATFLKRMGSDVDRMVLLVSDLLELSRLESGQVSPKLSAVDVGLLATDAIESLLAKAKEKRVNLEQKIAPGLYALADGEMLRQALSNLLENAIKFTPAGGSVTVSGERRGSSIAVAVADTGIGIAEEHLPRIFERFYKVDKARSGGGTGLGLAIVRHIVRAHGGDVSVKSQEEQGTTFTLVLPGAERP